MQRRILVDLGQDLTMIVGQDNVFEKVTIGVITLRLHIEGLSLNRHFPPLHTRSNPLQQNPGQDLGEFGQDSTNNV